MSGRGALGAGRQMATKRAGLEHCTCLPLFVEVECVVILLLAVLAGPNTVLPAF